MEQPLPKPTLRTMIEEGSFLKGKGAGGADIGANVLYHYGGDGSRYGEANYNTRSSTRLWPWPNQERIRKEMREKFRVTCGFCGAESLTKYIWEYLGNPMLEVPHPDQPANRKQGIPSRPSETPPAS